MSLPFENSDTALREQVDQTLQTRKAAGLEGMVGGLEAVVVNVEPESLRDAAQEFLSVTGYMFEQAWRSESGRGCQLRQEGSADFLFTCRSGECTPFAPFNPGPKSQHLPQTRLETFIFKCPDLERFVALQREQGRCFLTAEPIRTQNFLFIQTPPSRYTGNSIGFVQWLQEEGQWAWPGSVPLNWRLEKPDYPHLSNVRELDHAATRVRAEERDRAIIEFMEWTNYQFDFAVYVESLNSITNVARLSAEDFSMVFTSGIKPFAGMEDSGPTEKYIHNYNTRVHHLAFHTQNIEQTFQGLQEQGVEFLVELVGGPSEGLHQTFTKPMEHTLLVNEYILRYGDFDGFFTKSNVTKLTAATEAQ
ncbi:hypothetical protein SAMN02745704_01063 [Paucidesulfovibrio gracilis DSM 16080]|uniref:VOC domain-containing protein n=1 Tax=Paucidesulfovibrio gracilis DSM 16080 TaxID=1121449 RepID=A0A1T4WM12_9BACT|nr:hypothetical protein SAMN02745704_01063 [Paucidesulfovibrio gracilis DSM 16080]